MNDDLNLATIQPLNILVNLRMKCLLHYFGLVGRSLNLKVIILTSRYCLKVSLDLTSSNKV